MKKIIVVMLLILPFFLMIFIGLTGRITGEFTLVKIEEITVNVENDSFSGITTKTFDLSVNERFQVYYTINPDDYNSSDIKVESSNEDAVKVTLSSTIDRFTVEALSVATNVKITIYCNVSNVKTVFYFNVV